ncbi:MAG: HAD-IA family hydrolase [Gammaproteobacteria bacterium]|nr:HAD-IA family hydrolase [Gammaproteobacteria bacterium]
MIRAVLFDADGVLQQPSAGWRDKVAQLCGDPDQTEAFVEEVFTVERPCFRGRADFGRALDAVLKRWNSRFSVDEALQVWTLIEADSNMLEVVDRLRGKGLTVGLATNQQAYRADFMTFRLGYAELFDHLFYSCYVGYAKPSDEYFQAVLERLSVPSREVLFLDDHETNVQAARQLGFQAEVLSIEEGASGAGQLLDRYGISL